MNSEEAFTVAVQVGARPDGLVALKLVAVDEDGTPMYGIGGIKMPPSTARKVAEKLTLASFQVEDNQ